MMLSKQGKAKKTFFNSITFLVLLGFILLTTAVIFWRIQEADNLNQVAAETASLTRSYARETEFQFNRIYEALELLSDQLNMVQDQENNRWEETASFYVQNFTGLEDILLVDTEYVVQQSIPSDHQDIYQGQKANMLTQGAEEIHIWIPVYDGPQFKGFMLSILDIPTLMTPVLEETKWKYDIQVTEEKRVALETNPPFEPDPRFATTVSMLLQNETVLNLTLTPTRETIKAASSSARTNFFFSLFAIISTIAAVYFAQKYSLLANINQEKYINLFNASSDAIFTLDLMGRFGDANPAASKLVGYSNDEILSMQVGEVLISQHRPSPETQLALWYEGGQIEVQLRHKDGHAIPAELIFSPVPQDSGQQLSLGIARDISERKELELQRLEHNERLERMVKERTVELNARVEEVENLNTVMGRLLKEMQASNRNLELAQNQLTSANEELEAFSYSVSHDLRAPLRHVDGFISLFKEREKDRLDSTSQHYLDNVTEAVIRMGEMIDDLLSFSRTSRSLMTLIPVDMDQVVRGVIAEQEPYDKKASLTFDVHPLETALADPSLLKIVWDNLISNAIKFSSKKEEAHIEIGCQPKPSNNEVEFFIRDNGAGFDPQFSNKLFKVFQRLHSEEEFTGIGIGLATVKRIISRHGGAVWAEGAEDQGASFHFTLTLIPGK